MGKKKAATATTKAVPPKTKKKTPPVAEDGGEGKRHVSWRQSAEAHDLTEKLSKKLGVTRTACREMGIRALAEKEGIK